MTETDLELRLDFKQILSEAQHRWLRPAEICQILTNYQMFHISPEAPDKPVSGSVFLFDRKVLRRFRNDGHNWRKKKDGKIVKEAHEKLKVGSVDMLHCYYAHGEGNENFQRRSYWLLDEGRMHIVFVHYLEVKGNKTSISYVGNTDRAISNSENDSCVSPSFHGTIPSSAPSSSHQDTVSDGNFPASSGFHSYPQYHESPLTDDNHSPHSNSYNLVPGEISYNLEPRTSFPGQITLQQSLGGGLMNFHPQTRNQNLALNLHDSQGSGLVEAKSLPSDQGDELQSYYQVFEQELNSEIFQPYLSDADSGNPTNLNSGNSLITTGNENAFSNKPVISGLQTDARLQKVDSFTRWMAKELGEGDELDIPSSNRISWSIMGSEDDTNIPAQLQVDSHTLSPSISQDQLFSIIDVYPNWVYSGVELKVLITGKFLEEFSSQFGFSVMFGEVEVPAEVLADGIICCSAPVHRPGTVPLYVTCSNRVACSEIREFEYRLEPNGYMSSFDESATVMYMYRRFEMILRLESVASPASVTRSDFEKQSIVRKITSLMEEENKHDTKLISESDASQVKLGELLLERQLRQKFYLWLVQMVTENGKGPTLLDEWGQSVLHLAGALGFNWAFQPIIASGTQLDFRDVKGWTALHWAAFYGREETVAALVALGARPGALADPRGENRLGMSPADLASLRGHKGISGFLAEISVTTQLSTLTVNDKGDTEVSEVCPIQAISGEGVSDTLSHKDSLDAVRHAAQAVARIHQIFRIQSFQRKQFNEQASDEIPDDEKVALSFVASKSSKYADRVSNAAAVRIQKKYRGWKKRKEFLLIRQKVVKIQAHIRGHQVRKKYKNMYWTLGVMQAALRWRHKMSGLPEFRSNKTSLQGPSTQSTSTREDDDDIVKQGRKQIEERMQKALARVKSMAQNPEARAQYHRLLTAAEGFKEPKEEQDILSFNLDNLTLPDNLDDLTFPDDDDMFDFSNLLDNDTFMSSFQ